MCLSAQDLDAGKSLVFVKMQYSDNNVLDNNGNPCAKIVVETSIKGMDIVGGYIISEITSTSKGYEFYVSVPKRQGQYITFFHDEFNSLSIPLWIDGALTGGAEYALHINKIANVSMESFYANSGMTSLDLSSLRTSMVINMRQMFSRCGKLTRLDLRNFDTSNVRDMSGMFEKCSEGIEGAFDFPSEYSGLQSLDLSSFNTSNVTDMSRMFSWCSALKSLNVSSFNTANVTDMSEMFAECYVLTTLNLSSFNTSKVTNMHRMFGCFTVAGRQGRIKVLDLSSFKTSTVRDM